MSPMRRDLYPPNWEAISRRVRADAGNRCQFCGVRNGSIRITGSKATRIVLTVAHLDHDPRNNDDRNLRALCQRCHLRHDARLHAANAARTRAAKRLRKQPLLFGGSES